MSSVAWVIVVSLLYTAAGLSEFWKGQYAWGTVWLGYATAGYALVWIRMGP